MIVTKTIPTHMVWTGDFIGGRLIVQVQSEIGFFRFIHPNGYTLVPVDSLCRIQRHIAEEKKNSELVQWKGEANYGGKVGRHR